MTDSKQDGDGESGEPLDDDPRIAELVGRIKRSRDPTAGLLRPLSDDERRAIADRVLASVASSAKVVPLHGRPPPRRFLRAAWFLPALAAAFALVFFVTRGGPSLTAYRLDLEGDAMERGEPSVAGAVRLRPETKLRVKLSPAEPVRDVALRLIVVQSGKARVISPPSMQDGQGAFTIEELAGKLLGDLADGPIELVFAVGHPLPDDAELERLALDPAAEVPSQVRLERRSAVLIGFEVRTGALGVSGCKSLKKGPICEVGEGAPIHVWAPGSDASRFSLRVDDREVGGASIAIEGGLRWTVAPPAGSRALTLVLGGRELLRMPLEEAPAMPLIVEADALRSQGKLDEAEALLDEVSRGASPAATLAATRLRAKVARRRGDGARATALREQAILADREAGRVSDEVDDQLARVFDLLFQENALGEAKRRLDALAPIAESDAESRVKLDYYRGLFASEVGDLRTAIGALRSARVGARRLAMDAYEGSVSMPLADLLSGLGRYDEASSVIAQMEGHTGAMKDPCDRAHLVMYDGWIQLRLGRTTEAARRLGEAERIAREGCDKVLGDVLTNVAFERREAGAFDEARDALAAARKTKSGPDARMGVWQDRLAIELALEGDPQSALAAADKVLRAGEHALSPELLFEGELGRARALDALGDTGEAGRGYASAEQALDAWGSLVPLGEGREAFLLRQERAGQAWIDFLRREAARSGPEGGEALARAVRRSVARFYRLLDEGDRRGALAAGPDDAWSGAIAAYRAARAGIDAAVAEGKAPTAADLATVRDEHRDARIAAVGSAAPRPGELVLAYHPVPAGWIGVATDAAGVTWKELGRVDPAGGREALSTALLAPFRDRIAHAEGIRVHAHRALASVAFHALPWDGGALLDRAPVSYGVDLPEPPATPSGSCGGAPAALVVADTRQNLAGAAAAAGTVEVALAARGYTVERLDRADATIAAVTRALAEPCTKVFHYEGHAVFEGRDGVDASLLLADGRLTAVDILRLAHVPEIAVLSGCSTAEADGLGLAHAFLARGAEEVLATATPVADSTAALLARSLYEPSAGADGSSPRLAEGLRSVSMRLRQEGVTPGDWPSYRVLRR